MPATSLGAPVSRRTLLRMCAAAAASSRPAIDIMADDGARSAGGGDVDPIPLFIQWATGSVHPSDDSPPRYRFEGLEFRHQDPEALRRTLRRWGIDARVTRAPVPAIAATLGTPEGRPVIS